MVWCWKPNPLFLLVLSRDGNGGLGLLVRQCGKIMIQTTNQIIIGRSIIGSNSYMRFFDLFHGNDDEYNENKLATG